MSSILVYRYHCEPATRADDEILQEQIRLAAEYQQELALIENRGRALLRSPRSSLEVEEWARFRKEGLDGGSAARRLARSLVCEGGEALVCADPRSPPEAWLAQLRVRGVPDAVARSLILREQVIAARATGSGWDAQRAVEQAALESLVALGVSLAMARSVLLRDALQVVQGDSRRAARAAFVERGLYWGTYQHAEEAFDASCRTTSALDDVRTGYARTTGCAAVHLQPARPLRGEADDWIRIGQGMERRGSEIDRSGRVRPARHRRVSLRVGTEHGRRPKMASVLVLMDRDLPEGAVVSWARVKRRQVGPRYRWELHVTFGLGAGADLHRTRPAKLGDAVGVDIGWRQLNGGVRIARWWGTDGRSGEVQISDYVLGGDKLADSLRAIRDRNKAALRGRLQAWLAELAQRPQDDAGTQERAWILEETRQIHAWLKTWRFVRLADRWRDQRIPGDEPIFAAVVAWLKQDRHLWSWEANARARRKRQVDEQIRVLAVRLSREYARIGIEAPMVAQIVRRAERCEACRDAPGRCAACAESERLRSLAATRVPHAAPARTRQEIKTFAPGYGATVIELDPAYTTLDCAGCGYRREEVRDWSPLAIGCVACGAEEDQDLTAAKNLARLASEAVRGEDGRPLAVARPGGRKRKLGVRRTRKSSADLE